MGPNRNDAQAADLRSENSPVAYVYDTWQWKSMISRNLIQKKHELLSLSNLADYAL